MMSSGTIYPCDFKFTPLSVQLSFISRQRIPIRFTIIFCAPERLHPRHSQLAVSYYTVSIMQTSHCLCRVASPPFLQGVIPSRHTPICYDGLDQNFSSHKFEMKWNTLEETAQKSQVGGLLDAGTHYSTASTISFRILQSNLINGYFFSIVFFFFMD